MIKNSTESVLRDTESAPLPNKFHDLPVLILRPATAQGLLSVHTSDIAALPPPAAPPIPSEVVPNHAVPDPASLVVPPSTLTPLDVSSSNAPIKNDPPSGGARLAKPFPLTSLPVPIGDDPLTTTQPQSSPLPIPPHFVPLITVLEALRSKNITQPSRSQVASILSQTYAGVYKAAGVTRWKEYANLAVARKLITLGRVERDAWVSLAVST